MTAAIVRFRWRFTTLLASVFVCAGIAYGQEPDSAARGSFGVPLQPFSLHETADAGPRAEPIRVAYYAPRSQPALPPRAESVEAEDDLETTNAFPEINSKRPIVAGDRAILRNAIAYAPSHAPDNIKNAIWAVNTLRRKPYVWGGGHASFNDYGRRGRGHWITIYSRNGHTFAIIAGLRLDTTDLRDGGDVGPRWYADGRDTRGFNARHPVGW